MSSRSLRDHLNDILQAAADIQDFVAGMTLEDYARNKPIRYAVERALLIIAEAAYRIGDDAESLSTQQDWKGLRGMGNFLRHHYHRVEDAQIWDSIHTDLPVLQSECKQALSSLQD